ncbi:MAG TPA: PASTA domain-containing protein [Polyangia bacterium]|nr:PASTA domain-containing protein [Polyangia bacterium]
MGRSAALTIVLAVGFTTATYLGMHFVVLPRLPVHAVDVPSLSGLTPDQARGLLEPRGLLLILDEERPDERATPGTLIDQRPLAGSRLRRGEDVHAAVAKAVRMPKLVGLTADAARDALDGLKLKPGAVTDVSSATVPKGQVLAQNPVPGAEGRPDGTVDLQVSSGPAAAAVPSVIGKSKSTATDLLQKAGFAVGTLHVGSNDDYDTGIVIRQQPAANTQAAPGTKVDLTIND